MPSDLYKLIFLCMHQVAPSIDVIGAERGIGGLTLIGNQSRKRATLN